MKTIDLKRPNKLYRYSERKWLERALQLGEFRLMPASTYKALEGDVARQDDERTRTYLVPGKEVQIKLEKTGEHFEPIGDVTFQKQITTDYLVLCMSRSGSPKCYDLFVGSDACLVIHDTEKFCERLHYVFDRKFRNWIGIDAGVLYGVPSRLHAAFSKPAGYAEQHEWRFAWIPPQPVSVLTPVFLHIGNIEEMAEIVLAPQLNEGKIS